MAAIPGAYIHLPFCRQKCPYCAFNSHPLPPAARVDAYLEALSAELSLAGAGSPLPVRTVYIGGGTPTCLNLSQLEELLSACRTSLTWEEGTEVTIEANPGTLDPAKLSLLREYGVNRLSLGLQSADDRLLQWLGRIHSYADFLTAWELARGLGFDNINVDLMFGLPEQSPADWEATLAAVVSLGPEHISAYSLTIEEGTPFYRQREAGQLPLPGEEAEIAMFAMVLAALPAAGYEHYEIANFARPGYRSKHNQIYWRNEEYWGFGAGAFSYRDHRRYFNYLQPEQYTAAILAGDSPVGGGETLTPGIERAETALMGLRLREGIDLPGFAVRFGRSLESVYPEPVARLIGSGYLERHPGRLALSERGLWVANRISLEFIPE